MSRASDPPVRAQGAAGLYLHVPFCATVCPYCDFAVRTGGAARRARWVASLLGEIDLVARAEPWPAFDTIYLGGGTPSLLPPGQLSQVLASLRARFRFAPDTLLDLEANPEDATASNLAAWRGLGVSRLSLGVQSFDDAALGFLGRRHSSGDARAAVERALAAGFATVSVDLIYGLPSQDEAALRDDLSAATSLGVPHLSCYQLSMPEGTRLGRRLRRGELSELGEDAQADRFVLVHRFLADRGYAAYEVSNFARAPEHRSRHNRKYWCHAPYLGLGPGAHSFDGRRRSWNERSADDYEARLARGERPVAGEETLAPRDLALETLMLGLRTAEGVDLDRFHARFGIDLAATAGVTLARLESEGLLEPDRRRLRPTLRGWAVADALAALIDPGGATEGGRSRTTSPQGPRGPQPAPAAPGGAADALA